MESVIEAPAGGLLNVKFAVNTAPDHQNKLSNNFERESQVPGGFIGWVSGR